MPVTRKAQESEEYKTYLAGCGEDDTIHYDVKIKAAGLLLDNIGNTFVTPVFNGSVSLRDAAGAMIENTVKSVRRGQQVDDGYIENLYSDMTSLYRLDQISRQNSMNSGQTDLGRLPGTTAVLLLACLAGAWILILLYIITAALKKGKQQ